MKNNLRVVLQLIDIKDKLIEDGETELSEKLQDCITDIEKNL